MVAEMPCTSNLELAFQRTPKGCHEQPNRCKGGMIVEYWHDGKPTRGRYDHLSARIVFLGSGQDPLAIAAVVSCPEVSLYSHTARTGAVVIILKQ